MIFVDTSHLLALAMPVDALHKSAAAWSEALPGPFLTTEYVLLEFVNALSSPSHRARAHSVLSGILASPGIQVVHSSPELFRSGVALHAQRPDKSWSLTDCVSFVVMRTANISEALTYDQHFEQAGFRALLRYPPSP